MFTIYTKQSSKKKIVQEKKVIIWVSYETIWNEGKRTVTLKRARGPAKDKKDLHSADYHKSKQTRNKKTSNQNG